MGSEDTHRHINHPDHTSGGREGMAAGVTVFGASMFAVDLLSLPLLLDIFLSLLLGAAAWFLMTNWITGLTSKRSEADERDYQAMIEADTRRKMAEARKSGKLDRWEKDE